MSTYGTGKQTRNVRTLLDNAMKERGMRTSEELEKPRDVKTLLDRRLQGGSPQIATRAVREPAGPYVTYADAARGVTERLDAASRAMEGYSARVYNARITAETEKANREHMMKVQSALFKQGIRDVTPEIYETYRKGAEAIAQSQSREQTARQEYLKLTAEDTGRTLLSEYEKARRDYLGFFGLSEGEEGDGSFRLGSGSSWDSWRGSIRDAAEIEKDLGKLSEARKRLEEAEKSLNVDRGYLSNLGENWETVYANNPAVLETARGAQRRLQEIEDNRAKLDEREKALREEMDYSRFLKWEELRGKADFEKRSGYTSTANGREKKVNYFASGTDNGTVYDETGFDDLTYDAINGNQEARDILTAQKSSMWDMLYGEGDLLSRMTPEEISLYNYVHATQGREKANEYLGDLRTTLTERQRSEYEANARQYAQEHPVKASAWSVLSSPAKGLSYIGQAADYLVDGRIDQNAAYNRFAYQNSATRDEVAKRIEASGKWGKAGSFLYQTGMSMGDFLMDAAVSGGNEALSLAIMGTGAAADAVVEAKDRGLSDRQSFTLGTIAGAAEIVTEKVSLETLLDKTAWTKDAVGYFLKNVLAEGSEEAASDIINWTADVLVAKDKSQWRQAIRAYEERGMSESDAFIAALKDKAVEIGLDALGGALSGAVMGAPGAVSSAVNAGRTGESVRYWNEDEVRGLINGAMSYGQDSAAYQAAERLQAKIDAGREISRADVGSLINVTAQTQAEVRERERREREKAEDIKIEPSARTSASETPTVQPVNAIDGSVKNPLVTTPNAGISAAPGENVRNAPPSGSSDTTVSQTGADINDDIPPAPMTIEERDAAVAERERALEARTREFQEAMARGEDVSRVQEELMAEADDIQREKREIARAEQEEITARQRTATTLPTGREIEERRERAGDLRELERSGRESGATEEQIGVARRIADATGRRIVFMNEGQNARRGVYQNGTIYVNAAYGNETGQIIAHELTHSIESSGSYDDFSRLVQRRIMESGGDLEGTLKEVRERYAAAGVELDAKRGDDMREVVAEYVERELLTSPESITDLVTQDRSLGRRILDALDSLLAKITRREAAKERAFIRRARDLYAQALRDTRSSADSEAALQTLREAYAAGELTEEEFDRAYDTLGIGVEEMGGGQSSIAESFTSDFDSWLNDKDSKGNLKTGGYFRVGTTSEALRSIGVNENTIYWDKNKIADIMKKHPEMTPDVIKQVPQILENPILVMQSQTRANRITLFGMLTDADGTPILAAMELRPQNKQGEILNYSKVTSAYAKQAAQNLMNSSDILYVDPNKNRTDSWLEALRLQLPAGLTKYGSVGRVTYSERDVNGNLTFGDGDGKTEMRRAFERAGEKTQFSVADGTQAETEGQEAAERDIRNTVPAKAKGYLERAERRLVSKAGELMQVPRFARREYLQDIARKMSREYLTSGSVSQETREELFEEAYARGVEVDREFYDQYKELKRRLRETPVTISEKDQPDVRGYDTFEQFRQAAFGTLRLIKEGATPVDTVYQELSGTYPELFPEDITHPADQIVRMFEVGRSITISERTLEEALGPNAGEYKAWMRNDFDSAVGDMVAELRAVKRYAEDRTAREKTEGAALTLEEVKELYPKARDARKNYEKVNARNLLTAEDQRQVGRLMRGDIELSDLKPERDNVKGITEVFKAKQEYEQYARQIREWNEARRASLRDEADGYLATANGWKDKKKGILYSRETMERNIRDIVPDQELANRIVERYFTPVHRAAAQSTRLKNQMRDRVRALELSRKVAEGNEVSEAHAVQLLGEARDNIDYLTKAKHVRERDGMTLADWRGVVQELYGANPNMDWDKVDRAIDGFRKIYDELFELMNDSRVRNGYEPVAYRKGYFPHFQPGEGDGILALFGKALGISTEVTALPTTINGLTHTFRPGIQYFGNALERTGFNTCYDAVEGFDKYIEGVADVIYQTENIQRLRALASQARYRTGDEGIRKQIDEIRANESLAEQDKQSRIEQLHEKGRFTLSNFVVELEEYTNLLANKKSRADRNMEQALGRNAYNLVKTLEGRVAANMVAVNPGSWLTNFIPLTQGGAMLDRGMILHGMWDTLRAVTGKFDDDIVSSSTFLTNRRGSDPLVRTWQQRASAAMSRPMEWIDNFTADSLVRARYRQNVQNRQMSEAAAMEEADAWVAGVMADRSKGSTPTLFNRSNPLTKLFTQFQLEVNNQLSYVYKDMPRGLKEKGLGALAAALFKFALGAWLYDEVYEYFIGRRAALDPIGMLNDTVGDLTGWELPNLVSLGVGAVTGDMPSFKTGKTGIGQAGINLAEDVAEEMPFVGGLLGGGRLPISSAVPDIGNLWGAATNSGQSGRKRWNTAVKEIGKPLTYLLLPFGGGQMKKILEGVSAVIKGGSYTVDSQGRDILQYPIYNDSGIGTAGNALRASLFGKSSFPGAQRWGDSEFKNYSAKATGAYQGLTQAGVRGSDADDLVIALTGAEKTGEKSQKEVQIELLRSSKIPEDIKIIPYYALMASEKEIELIDELAGNGAAGDLLDMLMSYDQAGRLTEGKADAQRKAVFDSKLTDREKITALGILESISSYTAFKMQTAQNYGITMEDYYAGVYGAVDTDGDGKVTQKDKITAIAALNLSNEKKAVLYQLADSGWTPKNNPFATGVGQEVYDLIQKEKERRENGDGEEKDEARGKARWENGRLVLPKW